jgi:SAM-dependent methyltransferase
MSAIIDQIIGSLDRIAARFGRPPNWLRFNWMYLRTPPWDTGESPPELLDFIRRRPPGSAIDLGCGTGTNICALGKAGWQVVGVEFVPRAARAARRKLRRAGVAGEVRIGDVSRLEITSGSYDLVVDIGCYHGLPENSRQRYRQNLPQIMKPGGTFLLYVNWQPEDQRQGRGRGITQPDLSAFQRILTLENRQDSRDRWDRQASWFWFQK